MVAKLPHPSWKRVSNTDWEQPYGFQDSFYGNFVGKAGEPALFLVATSISVRLSSKHSHDELIQKIRTAWIQMRYAYPIIATIKFAKKRTYHCPQTEAEIEAWAEETLKIESGKTIQEIWSTLVKTQHPTLHFFPDTSELFLQAEHTHFDGRGLLHFWDEYLKLLVDPKPVTLGHDIQNLPGRADDYLNISERAPGRGRALADHMLGALEALPPETPINYPLKNMKHVVPPSTINSRASLKLTPEDTLRINNACKAKNLSLAGVWHASMVKATQDIQRSAGLQPGSSYATFANFDLRRYFRKDGREHVKGKVPIGNYHAVLPYVTKPNGRPFRDTAQDLSSFYRLGLQEQPDILSAIPPMMETMGAIYSQGLPTDTTPAISSIGVVDHFVKPKYEGPAGVCYVDDFWIGDTCLGPWMECFIWLFRGSLYLGTCYNGACYSENEVDLFHDRVRNHILEGLGLTDGQRNAKL